MKDFIKKYSYNLLDTLTYNSYRTWNRSETRDWDSVSITEILWLIEDPNMEMCKRFYSDKMKEACDFWTKQHKMIEEYIISKQMWSWEVFNHFMLFTIKYWVTKMKSELDYKVTYKWLPTVTGAIDCVCIINELKYLIDWKTSRRNRSFKSVKYNLQKAWYRWLSWIKYSWLVYLNKKWYEFVESKDYDYWDRLWLELLEYANDLYIKWKFNNLYIKK